MRRVVRRARSPPSPRRCRRRYRRASRARRCSSGTDQEYGPVTRLANGFTDFPGAEELGGIADTAVAVQQTELVTAAAAQELLAVGVTVDFAPVADLAPQSGDSGIEGRMFGSDPERTGQLVAAAVRGFQSGGVAATLKHFPGIGRLPAGHPRRAADLRRRVRRVECGRGRADEGRASTPVRRW